MSGPVFGRRGSYVKHWARKHLGKMTVLKFNFINTIFVCDESELDKNTHKTKIIFDSKIVMH